MDNPYESFSHGLVVSKLWLCETLESILDEQQIEEPSVNILGGWTNVLAFMLLVRRPKFYSAITSYDLNEQSTIAANKICDMWRFESPRVTNITTDVNLLDFSFMPGNSLIVNCSVDQFVGTSWYKTIPRGTLVAMQTTDIVADPPPWEITQRCPNISTLLTRYPLNDVIFAGTREIRYDAFGYDRLMAIGKK